MKKAIKRFWGVGLVVILLSSMLVAVAPVAADDNAWTGQPTPGGPTFQLAAGSNVSDLAVQGNGAVVYAVTGTDNFTYKSTNGGVGWAKTQTTALALITPTKIAVAPDNANMLAITDGTNVYVSVNGGVVFVNITAGLATTAIKDVTISPVRLGANYVTVCGVDGTLGSVSYYNLGAVVGQSWTEKITPNSGSADSVAFSPNFLSDLTMEAVTSNLTTGKVMLQVYSFSTNLWNTADYPNYPVTIATDLTWTAINTVSMALDPAFLGGEDTLRNTFIGIDSTGSTTLDGIYRVLNASVRNLAAGKIYSIAYDGTTLVAGQTNSLSVLRSLDPMSSVPTVSGTSTYKSPGGTGNVVVAFVGTNIAAGTSGANSAFALSRSSGAAFNDISLIDTALTTVNDFAVSPDSAKMYLVTNDGVSTSVWFKAAAWERVLTYGYTNPYIVRLSPTNPDVIYVGEKTSTKVWYSKDVQSRWYQRTCTTTIADMAVESDDVAYVLNATGGVVKSSNDGFIWGGVPTSTTLTAGYSLVSAGANILFAGSTNGKVAYSLDGGTTWTGITPVTENGATNIIVIPSEAYATTSIIYAATTALNLNIMQWTVGTSTAWTDAYNGPNSMGVSQGTAGPAMKGGILYALTYDTVSQNSTLLQYIPSVNTWTGKFADAYVTPSGALEPVVLGVGTASPNALDVSTGKLWAIKTNSFQALYMLADTLAAAGPALTGPADKSSVITNNGGATVVIPTWTRPANATGFTVQLAYDSAFTQQITITGSPFAFPTTNCAIGGPSAANGVTLIPGTTYYWRVRASSPLSSPWSEVRTFTVQPLAAAVPAISSPVNGATITNQSPAFSWTPVTGTTQYDFQLSTTPTFGTTIMTDTPVSSGALVPVTIKLDQGKQYFWRVRASLPIQGDWSAVANFFVAAPAATAPAPVTITVVPAPTIVMPTPAAPTTYTLAPQPVNQIAPSYIWAIIIIGGILVIAVIVLIVRALHHADVRHDCLNRSACFVRHTGARHHQT